MKHVAETLLISALYRTDNDSLYPYLLHKFYPGLNTGNTNKRLDVPLCQTAQGEY